MITIFNRQKLIECNTEEIRMKAGQCLKNNNIEYKVKYKIVTGEIMDKLNGKFPKTLPLSEQGKFIIGYYQQTQDFYKKKEDKEI